MLRRHHFRIRFTHLVLVVVVVVQTISGLGFAERLPAAGLNWLGHTRIATLHYWLGHAFAIAAVVLFFTLAGRAGSLISSLCRFRAHDLPWPVAFLRMSLSPKRYSTPWHDGRFDPIQRLDLLAIGGSLGVLALSGAVIDLAPPNARQLIAWAIRVHSAAGITLIVVVSLHVIMGSGLLPTHRGIARSMFGDGMVSAQLAERLWPGWTRRHVENGVTRVGEQGSSPTSELQGQRSAGESAPPAPPD